MEYDYATGSHSIDPQKLTDIKIRKKLLEDKTTEKKVEGWGLKVEGWNSKIEKEEITILSVGKKKDEDKIETKSIALEQESSTIQDTETKEIIKKDRKKEHEIFRNF